MEEELEVDFERNYSLEIGDVVLIYKNGFGFNTYDIEKYVEVVGFSEYLCDNSPALLVVPYDCKLNTPSNKDLQWKCGYESFGEVPMILLNTKEEHNLVKIRVTTPVHECQGLYYGTEIGDVKIVNGDAWFKYKGKDWILCKEDFHLPTEEFVVEPTVEEYTGSSSNYYKVFVKNPTTLEHAYEAECNDIIEALKMTFAEGNAFKAIWRKAKARQGVKKKGYDNGVYDSEKVVFFGERMLVEAKDA